MDHRRLADRSAPAVEARSLSKRYGQTTALDAVSLVVERGTVFGYLGPNGAGKSTTIRILLGLIRPTQGEARILGHDVVHAKRDVHRVVGYLPGDFAGYRDLTARQELTYLANLRGLRDLFVAEQLAERFNLDLDRRIAALSHGNRQKVGIIQAFMHRPQLLVLDEPTTGLDPLMQREFLELVREARAAGSTVFLSSHVLTEVEAVADTVGFIRSGQLRLVTSVDELRSRARRRVTITFTDAMAPTAAELRAITGVRDAEVDGDRADIVVEGSMAELFRAVSSRGIDRVVSDDTDLEDLFLQHYEAVPAPEGHQDPSTDEVAA